MLNAGIVYKLCLNNIRDDVTISVFLLLIFIEAMGYYIADKLNNLTRAVDLIIKAEEVRGEGEVKEYATRLGIIVDGKDMRQIICEIRGYEERLENDK